MKRAMKYWALLSGGITLVGALLWSRFRWDILLTVAITAGTVFYHAAVRLLVGVAFDRFLNNRTDYRKRWYQVAPWETALYEKLGVKGWKRRMPTYDPDTFDPSLHSWEDIARAMCQAELVHEVNVAASFVPLVFSVWFGDLPVFLITSVLAVGFDLLFVILQRYNRPRVLRLAARAKHRERN